MIPIDELRDGLPVPVLKPVHAYAVELREILDERVTTILRMYPSPKLFRAAR